MYIFLKLIKLGPQWVSHAIPVWVPWDPWVGCPWDPLVGSHVIPGWALGDPVALGDQGPWGQDPWAPAQYLVTPPGSGSILYDDPPSII